MTVLESARRFGGREDGAGKEGDSDAPHSSSIARPMAAATIDIEIQIKPYLKRFNESGIQDISGTSVPIRTSGRRARSAG